MVRKKESLQSKQEEVDITNERRHATNQKTHSLYNSPTQPSTRSPPYTADHTTNNQTQIMTLNNNEKDFNAPEMGMEIVLNNTSNDEEDLGAPYSDDAGDKERGNPLNKHNVAATILGLCLVIGISAALLTSNSNDYALTTSSNAAVTPSETLMVKSSKSSKAVKSSKTPNAKASKTPKSMSTNPNESSSPSASVVPSMLPSSSIAPSMLPSSSIVPSMLPSSSIVPSSLPSTSSAPSFTRDKDIKNLLLSATACGLDAIDDEGSPQGKAFSWLTSEDCIDPPLHPGNDFDDAQIIQRYILAVYYYTTNGDDWASPRGWLGCDGLCSVPYGDAWSGLNCHGNGRDVLTWYAWTNEPDEIVGTIPCEIGSMTGLTGLYFYNNQFSGTIPPELGSISTLVHLQLYGNQMTGTIPVELGQLSNLEQLDLNQNKLSGTIPTQLEELDNLERLWLWKNSLTGTIPTQLAGMDKLRVLHLGDNDLSGTIPSELGEFDDLVTLFLQNNDLSGTIPTQLGELDSLVFLDLSGNVKITGSIPAQICALNLNRLWADCDVCNADASTNCCTQCF